jgi:outer membrane protein assembly factor BamB
VVPNGGGYELIVNSSRRIDAYNPANGSPLWHLGTERQTPIPTPVQYGGLIYMIRGYRNSDFYAIRPGGHGDMAGSDNIVWRAPREASYVPSILYYQGLVYVTNEVGVVLCSDAEAGKRVWQHPLGGIFFASPVAGDGKIYMVSETGETYVLQAGRGPVVLATNDIGERLMASPAISNGKIYLRSDGTLYAIGD